MNVKGVPNTPNSPCQKSPVGVWEQGGVQQRGPRPGPNGGNSAEVKLSFCSFWIKRTFERQRAFLFHRGPSKAAGHACSELCCFGVCVCAWG